MYPLSIEASKLVFLIKKQQFSTKLSYSVLIYFGFNVLLAYELRFGCAF